MDEKSTTIKQLRDRILAFTTDRNWQAHHTPQNLAISISLEAAELLEHFQWDFTDTDITKQSSELADILIYCIQFANLQNIDIAKAIDDKLDKTEKKYPKELYEGTQDDKIAYQIAKKAHRAKENS